MVDSFLQLPSSSPSTDPPEKLKVSSSLYNAAAVSDHTKDEVTSLISEPSTDPPEKPVGAKKQNYSLRCRMVCHAVSNGMASIPGNTWLCWVKPERLSTTNKERMLQGYVRRDLLSMHIRLSEAMYKRCGELGTGGAFLPE